MIKKTLTIITLLTSVVSCSSNPTHDYNTAKIVNLENRAEVQRQVIIKLFNKIEEHERVLGDILCYGCEES